MIYTTETIAAVVTSEAARRALDYLSPVYGEAANFLAILDAAGYETDELCGWIDSFAEQGTPSAATWAIPYWEAEYGLAPLAGESTARRRERVLKTIQAKGPISPYRLEQAIKAATGATADIVERPGTNRFGVRIREAGANMAGLLPLLEARKPAHLRYTLIHTAVLPGPVYAGGIVKTYKKAVVCQ